MPRGQGESQQRQRPAVPRPEHDVQRGKVRKGICKREQEIEFVDARRLDRAKNGNGGVKKQEERGEDQGAFEFRRLIKLFVPTPEINHAEEEGYGRQRAPIAAEVNDQETQTEHEKIAKENDLLIFTRADEDGRQESANQGKQSNTLGIPAQGHRSHPRGDRDHRVEAHIPRVQRVVLAARPEGKVHHCGAQPRDAFGEIGVAAAQEPLAPRQHGCAEKDADSHAADGANPVVVKGVFQKESGGANQGHDADTIHPSSADDRLPIQGRGFGL